jgi:hypothetical protein
MSRPEPRYSVCFPVYLTWQDKDGPIRRAQGKCLNLSASGALVETDYPLRHQLVLTVHSDKFGRMGHATVRHCQRHTMKYRIGLLFTSTLALSDSIRQKLFLDAVQEK